MKMIEIIVAPNGSTRIETHGFAGATCQQASQFLEQALGRKTADQRTTEFHQQLGPATNDQRQSY